MVEATGSLPGRDFFFLNADLLFPHSIVQITSIVYELFCGHDNCSVVNELDEAKNAIHFRSSTRRPARQLLAEGVAQKHLPPR